MTCPACGQPLDRTGKPTRAGVLCTTCNHLWTVRSGQPVAVNAGNSLLIDNPAPVVEVPPSEQNIGETVVFGDGDGPLTAAKAAAFVEEEVG